MKTILNTLLGLTVISWPIIIGFIIWDDWVFWGKVAITDAFWFVMLIVLIMIANYKSTPEIATVEDMEVMEQDKKSAFTKKLEEAAKKKGYESDK